VSAQDGEADQLLSLIKQAGLGLFGGDEKSSESSYPNKVIDNNIEDEAEITVVGYSSRTC